MIGTLDEVCKEFVVGSTKRDACEDEGGVVTGVAYGESGSGFLDVATGMAVIWTDRWEKLRSNRAKLLFLERPARKYGYIQHLLPSPRSVTTFRDTN